VRIIEFPFIPWISIGENYAVQSFTIGLHLLQSSYTHDTCYFQHWDSQLSCIYYTAYTLLVCVAFVTILHSQILATFQATTWLVGTRPAEIYT